MSEFDSGLIDLFSGNAEATTAITESDDEFVARISTLIRNLPPHLTGGIKIRSAYRSNEEQAYLYDLYKKGQGNLAAPPGKSNHNHGLAMDLEFTNYATQQWVHANAERFGLAFPIESEAWHIEPIGLRDGTFHNGDQRFTPEYDDEDMYGIARPSVNNHSAETQLKRVADMLMGGTFKSQQNVLKDPRQLAERNLEGGVNNVQ